MFMDCERLAYLAYLRNYCAERVRVRYNEALRRRTRMRSLVLRIRVSAVLST